MNKKSIQNLTRMLDNNDYTDFYFKISLCSYLKEFSITTEPISKDELPIELAKWRILAKKSMKIFDLPECDIIVELYLSHNDKYKGNIITYTLTA